MGNDTKVTHVAFGGAVSTILVGVLSYVNPGLMGAIPAAEPAVALIITSLIAFFVPAEK